MRLLVVVSIALSFRSSFASLWPRSSHVVDDIDINIETVPVQVQDNNKDLTSTSTSTSIADGFASCLLIMDDNHRLEEWIAYHYHVMPLRKLVVAVDPRSQTSPSPILERWSDHMDIEQWTDRDIFSPAELAKILDDDDNEGLGVIKLHRKRQQTFNVKCMTHLRQEGAAWTLMTDVDEYAYVNPRVSDPSDPLFQRQRNSTRLSIEDPGYVLRVLRESESNNADDDAVSCIHVPRLQFGGIESTDEEVTNAFPATEIGQSLSSFHFDTFRWRHYGESSKNIAGSKGGVLAGKTMVNLSRIREDDVALFIGDPHRPIEKLCTPQGVWQQESDSLFLANHVLGTIEQYTARNDARIEDRIIAYESRNASQMFIVIFPSC